ncbi:MAG: tyrosine-protein phosphatase [Flavobacteriales bacterium]
MRQLSVDMHSHILPGIDDGAQNVQDSIQLVNALISLGYEQFICTPHVMGDYFPNTDQSIDRATKALQFNHKVVLQNHPLSATAEYFYDERLIELNQSKHLRTFAETSYFLFEFSFKFKPPGTKEFIYDAQMNGYKPILAHPERFDYMDLSKLEELKSRGVNLQLDLMSLVGHYGKNVQKLAKELIKAKMYDFVGTDIHRFQHVEVIEKALRSRLCHELVDTNPLKNQHFKQ